GDQRHPGCSTTRALRRELSGDRQCSPRGPLYIRTCRPAVAGDARRHPRIFGRPEPRDHVLGHPPRGLGTGAEIEWAARARDPAPGDDGRVTPGGRTTGWRTAWSG